MAVQARETLPSAHSTLRLQGGRGVRATLYGGMATRTSRLNLEGITVLVVEDHGDSRDLMCDMVGSFGASVIGARDGEEALAIASKKKPDLIFCDLRMPSMDGFEFIERLLAQPKLCRVPVIVVSGVSRKEDIFKTWTAGFSGHLVKPVTYEVVAAQLERVFWAHRRTGPSKR